MADVRQFPVPDGLAGMRLDAGLARLLGLSRTTVAGLIDQGDVLVDGAVAARSERLVADSWLEITLPEPERPVMARSSPASTASERSRSTGTSPSRP